MAKHATPDLHPYNKLIPGSVMTGEIRAKGDFRLDGFLKGTLHVEGKLVVGETGRVEGELFCRTADLFGQFEGEIHARDLLSMKSGCHVVGKIFAGRLVVEPGCVFNGSCQMETPGNEN